MISQLDVFLRVDNATASLIAKTIQPVIGSTADHNFLESLKFVERLNQTTRNNGPGVKAMGQRLTLDSTTRKTFNRVVDGVFARAYQSDLDPTTAVASSNASSGDLELYRPSSRQYNYFGLGNKSAKNATSNAATDRQQLSKPIVRPQSPSSMQAPVRTIRKQLPILDRPWPDQARNPLPPADFRMAPNQTPARTGYSVLVGGPRERMTPTRTAQGPTTVRLSDVDSRR